MSNQGLPEQGMSEPQESIKEMLNKVIIFKINEEYLAIPLAYVQEVLNVKNIRKIPLLNTKVNGVYNLRNNLLAIIDLHICLFKESYGIDALSSTKAKKIIVIQTLKEKFGILVEEIISIPKLEARDYIDIPSAISTKIGMDFINNIIILIIDTVNKINIIIFIIIFITIFIKFI